MNEIPPTQEQKAAHEPERPKRLLRSWDDRVLAGVCGGLGRYFGVDPILFRIGFGIAALTGIGLLAYLALYIFVPLDDGWGNPVPANDTSRIIAAGAALVLLIFIPGGLIPFADAGWWWSIVGLVFWASVLAAFAYGIYRLSQSRSGKPLTLARAAGLFGMTIVALLAAVLLAFASAWATAAGGGVVVAAVVIATGALLAVAAFRRPARWLILPAMALILPMAAVQASGFELKGTYGERDITPASISSIPSEGYELAAGDLTIDLRNLDWSDRTRLELPIDAGVGRASVIVPQEVCVSTDLEAWAGVLEVRGEQNHGWRVKHQFETVPGNGPELRVSGKIDAGVLEVVTEHPDTRDRGRHSPGRGEPQPARCSEQPSPERPSR